MKAPLFMVAVIVLANDFCYRKPHSEQQFFSYSPPQIPSSSVFICFYTRKDFQPVFRPLPTPLTSSSQWLAILLVISTNGSILNPGPVKFPCGSCSKPVRSNQLAICCDGCDLWYHTKCLQMPLHIYHGLNNSHTTWICCKCGLPNFSSSLFNSFEDHSGPNSFSALECISADSAPVLGLSPSPIASSSPIAPPSHKRKLRCIAVNCNSIRSTERSGLLAGLVDRYRPDIIFGCESKLDPSIPTPSVFPEGFTIYRKDRSHCGGGGIFIAVNATIPSYPLDNITTDPEDESLWISVRASRRKELILCSFYKPPSAPSSRIDLLSQALLRVFAKHKKSHPNVVIAGDFNCGDINWKVSPPLVINPSTAPMMNTLLDFIDDHALTQYVSDPTRPASLKTLDLVLSSVPSLVSNVCVQPGMSDHDIVDFYINTDPRRMTRSPHKIYLYNRMNIEGLRKDMITLKSQFTAYSSLRSVEENWTFFKKGIRSAIDAHVPSKMTKRRPDVPWLSLSLKRKLRKRERLLQNARRSGNKSSRAWSLYKRYRNMVTKELKLAHNRYLNEDVGGSLESNPKKFWNYVKHCRSENMGVPVLRTADAMHISDRDKAEILNKQFQSVFSIDDGSLPDLGPPKYPSIGDIAFSVAGVKKQLDNLQTCKAAGPDGLPARILHDLSGELSEMLCFLFQQSYNTSQLPRDWSIAMVVPVFKKDRRDNPANYRPISLTSLVCKVMEHVVLSHIQKHLSLHNILTLLQHGFRQGFSCVTQLVLAVHDWSSTVDSRGQVDAIMLDFSKAFDKVSHRKLIHKLRNCGIDGKTSRWIEAFLVNRSQFVVVDGSHSAHVPVSSGVPQGTVLGPTLFLIFINDIVHQCNSSIRLFADDAVVYRKITSQLDHNILQQDLNKLDSWARTWQMQFNTYKCQLLPITNKRNSSLFNYSLNSQSLASTAEYDYLGVRCSSDMRWNRHCIKVSAKANKTLGLLRRTLKPCDQSVKERAYLSMVRPTLEYASPVWSPYTARDVNKIEQVQKNAARFVTNNYHPRASTSGLVSSLNWDSLEVRRLHAQVVLFYKIRNNLVNIEFPICVQPNARSSRRNTISYRQIQSNVFPYSYSFFPRTVRSWNMLPSEVTNIQSLESFKAAALPALRSAKAPGHLRRL